MLIVMCLALLDKDYSRTDSSSDLRFDLMSTTDAHLYFCFFDWRRGGYAFPALELPKYVPYYFSKEAL